MSPPQRLVHALHDADPTRRRQSTRRVFDVRGPLDLKAFGRAVDGLVRRHEPLRTVYPSGTRQVVEAAAHQVLRVVSERHPRTAFDLEHGPLLSITVQPLGPDHHEISFCVHLLAADGWSLEVLFDDLGALYVAERLGVPPALPHLRIQYVDWASWHARRVSAERRAEVARWWRRALDGYPSPRRRSPTAAPEEGRRRAVTLDSSAMSEIRTLANSYGHTAFTLLAAACAITLTCPDHHDRLLLGLAVANRDHVAVERVLGFYVTLTVLPVDLRGDPPFSELMRRVAGATAAVYAHRELSFPDIAYDHATSPGRRASTPVQMPVIFAHHPPSTVGTLSLDGCDVVELPVFDTAKFALTIRAQDTADGACDIWAEYDPCLHSDNDIDTLLATYTAVLASVVTGADPRVSALRSRTDA
ncbi:condensation domain-containing protein [Streptomyces kaempferi]|uniref:condensation domain-containing protein n=1 Tax=Streptomyces kaempferi TaxID=333725 RepID=UPI0036D28091